MLTLLRQRDQLGGRPGHLFIDGQWVNGPGERFDQIHPSTNEVMTSFAEAGTHSDPMEVVDAGLSVRGVIGLRAADASVMPTPTSGATNAATMMIGDTAADMVLVDAKH